MEKIREKVFIFQKYDNGKLIAETRNIKYEHPDEEIVKKSFNKYQQKNYNLAYTAGFIYCNDLDDKHTPILSLNCCIKDCSNVKYIINLFQNIFSDEIIKIILQWDYFFNMNPGIINARRNSRIPVGFRSDSVIGSEFAHIPGSFALSLFKKDNNTMCDYHIKNPFPGMKTIIINVKKLRMDYAEMLNILHPKKTLYLTY